MRPAPLRSCFPAALSGSSGVAVASLPAPKAGGAERREPGTVRRRSVRLLFLFSGQRKPSAARTLPLRGERAGEADLLQTPPRGRVQIRLLRLQPQKCMQSLNNMHLRYSAINKVLKVSFCVRYNVVWTPDETQPTEKEKC
ncbi:hypothetical protein KUCAC02_035744 [Chaenocephalus aceratus]|nr:hypothetical protein KUCAC02_035744 [Chaenocephalus aceratus]